MQNPPGPSPAAPPPAAGSSSGLNTQTGSTLAYALTWVTGIVFLFVGKNDPNTKYHAAQSVVLFGGLAIFQILLNIVVTILSNISSIFSLLGLLGLLVSLFYFIMWIYCLYKAWTGNGARFEVPIVGGLVTPYAERLAGAVN